MDSLTKTLIDMNAAYDSAYSELRLKDDSIEEVEYTDGQDYNGTWVRAYHPEVGFSSKYYYAA
jgi:hypothetical protein